MATSGKRDREVWAQPAAGPAEICGLEGRPGASGAWKVPATDRAGVGTGPTNGPQVRGHGTAAGLSAAPPSPDPADPVLELPSGALGPGLSQCPTAVSGAHPTRLPGLGGHGAHRRPAKAAASEDQPTRAHPDAARLVAPEACRAPDGCRAARFGGLPGRQPRARPWIPAEDPLSRPARRA